MVGKKNDNANKRPKNNKYAEFSKAAGNFARVQEGAYHPPIVASPPAPVKPSLPSVEEIASRNRRAAIPQEKIEQSPKPLLGNILEAHADLLAGLLKGLPSSNDVDSDLAKIEKSYALLTQDRHRGIVSVPGFETLADVQKAVEKARGAAQEARAEKERQEDLSNLKWALHCMGTVMNSSAATEARDDVLSLLDKLGAPAAAVYPVGVTTDVEMRGYVAKVYEKALVDIAAYEEAEIKRYHIHRIIEKINGLERAGSNAAIYPEWSKGSDDVLAEIYKAVETHLGGNLLALSDGWGTDWNGSAEHWQGVIDNNHAQGVAKAGRKWLYSRWLNITQPVPPCDARVDFLEGGNYCIQDWTMVSRYNDVARGQEDFQRIREEWGSYLSPQDTKNYAAIQAESRRNEAVLFVIATRLFAKNGMRCDYSSRRTLDAVEKVGGLDVLDKIATQRYGLTPDLWNEMKAFVAACDVNPQQDANYRKDAGTGVKLTAGTKRFDGPIV